MQLCYICSKGHCAACNCGCHTSSPVEDSHRTLKNGQIETFRGGSWNALDTALPYPLDRTFFMIGNTSFCPPCKRAEHDILRLVKANGWTYLKWTVEKEEIYKSSETASAEFKAEFARRALETTKHTSIPRIWYKGSFIGGYSELQNLIESWKAE